MIRRLCPPVGRLAQKRELSAIPSAKVHRHPIATALRRWRAGPLPGPVRQAELGIQLAGVVAKAIERRGGESAVYAFDTAAVEAFERCSEGALKVLEQCVAPRNVQERVYQRLSGELGGGQQVDAYRLLHEREQAEWASADVILAPAEFVVDALVDCGVERAKIRCVPYGVDPQPRVDVERVRQGQGYTESLEILFAGAMTLRKGIRTIHELALRPAMAMHRIVLAGPVGDADRFDWPSNTELLGPLPRKELERRYRSAHVFILPSHLEGSATVIYEAMGHGLPVITTRESGSVIRHEKDGFLVDAEDTFALEAAIEAYASDPELRHSHGWSGYRMIVEKYTAMRYGERLISAVTDVLDH